MKCENCNVELEHVQGDYWRCPQCFLLYGKKDKKNRIVEDLIRSQKDEFIPILDTIVILILCFIGFFLLILL